MKFISFFTFISWRGDCWSNECVWHLDWTFMVFWYEDDSFINIIINLELLTMNNASKDWCCLFCSKPMLSISTYHKKSFLELHFERYQMYSIFTFDQRELGSYQKLRLLKT